MNHIEVLKSIPTSGPCDLELDKLFQLWDHTWSISQYGENYRLISSHLKVQISKEQATEIIRKQKLFSRKSPVFNKGIIWRSQDEDK